MAALRAVDSPVVGLIAPAGYGKSTTAAQFATASGRRLAWLSADARDGDAATLLRGIAAAIDLVAPLEDDVVDHVVAPGPSVWTAAVPHLGAALAGSPDLTVVVDDVDRITDVAAIDVLLTLADHLGEASRLILTGRTLGSIPVARLIARGRLTILGREELTFDERDAAAVLAANGRQASSAEVRDLVSRTEGWATGVYLGSLRTTSPGSERATGSPTSPERLVEEYLRAEVLGAMDPEDAARLLRWSVLDQLTGPLCDAVLSTVGSGAVLDRLERDNLFIIPLDGDRRWYRLHHLLSDVLRAELARSDPHAAVDLRRAAADWYAASGHSETALEYAIAADDVDRASALAIQVAQPAMNAGRIETVHRWFDWFEARAAGDGRPRLAATAAMSFAVDGDGERAAYWSEVAHRAAGPEPGPDAGLLAILRVCLSRSGVAAMVADAAEGARLITDDDPWRVTALTALGITTALDGDAEGARQALAATVARWERGSVANAAVCMTLVQSAVMALERGERNVAEAFVRRARGILNANGMTEHAVACAVDALDARIAMSHHAVDQARRSIAHSQRLRTRLGNGIPWLAVRARLDLIRVHIAMGDGGGARTLMAEVREILAELPGLGTLSDEQAELATRLSELRGGTAGATTLTIAELRLLPLLTTHLSFREIGERLFVSHNTVKTQAISIYRKLDATSRSEAIARAVQIGLLEAGGERFTPAG
jgi:LuxR family maltose regulon positive regulatory protein